MELSSKGLTFFFFFIALGLSPVNLLYGVCKSLLYSTDIPSLHSEECQTEREDNSETSHWLDDCPNTNEASTAEAENQELCSESNPEGLTGASGLALSSLKCTGDPVMESDEGSDAKQPQPTNQDERQVQAIH